MDSNKQHLFNQIYRTVGLAPVAWLDSPSTSTLSDYEVELSAEDEQEQWEPNNVSTLGLHHSVSVQFPSLNLITDKAEEAVMPKPYNSDHRRPPFPLIQDDDVSYNTGRDRAPNDMFYSIYKAGCEPSARAFTNTDIFTDIEEAIKCHGTTRLGAVIFRTPDSPLMQLRIRRSTKCVWNGESYYTERDYTQTLQSFLTTRSSARWYLDLLHLLTATDDRALRHIELRLRFWKYAEGGLPGAYELYKKFKGSFGLPVRRPDYARFLEATTTKAKSRTSIFSKASPCVVCRQPLGNTKMHKAIALPCDPKHIIGRDCLEEIMAANDPAKVCCPYPGCKKRIFTDAELLAELKFNVIKGKYHKDDRYTEWENEERANADLDISLASKNTYHITVHPNSFLALWRHYAETSIEPETLTHLNPLLAPEYPILKAVIEHHITHLNGISTTLATLDQYLRMQVFRSFHQHFLSAQLDRALLSSEKGWLHQDDLMRKMVRPGFAEFASRTLNRTLQHYHVRRCDCKEGEGKEMHGHGDTRLYYNGRNHEAICAEVSRETREMFLWQKGAKGREFLKEFRAVENKRDSVLMGRLSGVM